MKTAYRLLLIDKSANGEEPLDSALKAAGAEASWERATTLDGLAAISTRRGPQAVLWCLDDPAVPLAAALAQVREGAPDLPFIVVAGEIDGEAVSELRDSGVDNVVLRHHLERLAPTLKRELDRVQNKRKDHLVFQFLRESEARFRALATNLPGIVYQRVISREGTWRLTYMSPMVERLLGITVEDITADPEIFIGCVHPDDRKAFKASVRESMKTIAPTSLEYRIVHQRSGETRWLGSASIATQLANGAVQWDGIALDITARKAAESDRRALEQQLHHSQKLEALGTLAGGIAHDLNNTLVPVIALTRLALKGCKAEDPLHQDLATVLQAGRRARDLVKQILDFSRKEEAQRTLVVPVAIVREALQMLRASMPSSIHLDERLADVPPIHGDAGQIHQVVVNLVTNAAQAIGGDQGVVTVELTVAPDGAFEGGPAMMLEVRDTGCGMGQATIARIFEPFFTTKRVGEGTGLGLSVVHGIVKSHNGVIAVKSHPGKGTCFTIHLPLATMPEGSERSSERIPA